MESAKPTPLDIVIAAALVHASVLDVLGNSIKADAIRAAARQLSDKPWQGDPSLNPNWRQS